MMSWLQQRLTSAGYYFSRNAAHRNDIARIEKEVLEIEENIDAIRALESSRLQIALADEERRILSEVAVRTPENIVLKGKKVFSQCDEDGIIAAIFAALGGQKTFIEIACGDGLENNTRLLLLQGWRGVWVDASQEHIARIESMLGGLTFPRLFVERQFIDIDNVCSLIERYCGLLDQREVDFFPSTSTETTFTFWSDRSISSILVSSALSTTRSFPRPSFWALDTTVRTDGRMTITTDVLLWLWWGLLRPATLC